MASPPNRLSALRARLDSTTPAPGVVPLPGADGGVGGVGNLNLVAQGAVPGTPVTKSDKLFYPVLLKSQADYCLSYIGMSSTFCLRSSCTIGSHQDSSRRFPVTEPIVVIKKTDTVGFDAPSALSLRMDSELLIHWTSNPGSLSEWGEAFLAFKRCVEALPTDATALVTSEMLSAKKRFQRRAQDARTPARTLFPGSGDLSPKPDGYVEVPLLSAPSPFKPTATTMTLTGKPADVEKNLTRLIRRLEIGLETTTNNLIENRVVIKDQDKVLRGVESRLDTIQDQVGESSLGFSWEFDAPTLNGRVAMLAEKLSAHKPAVNISETQVLSWVESWWTKSALPAKLKTAEEFSNDCESFLTSLVTSFQQQAGEVASLAVKVNSLVVPSPPVVAPTFATGASTFATLQQTLGLTSGASVPPASSIPATATTGHDASSAIMASQAATIAALEQRVRALDTKFAQLSNNTASSTIQFGGAGFSNPNELMPLIKAQMKTSYFGCFVNAAILLEWIQGNSGNNEDALTYMNKMHKLNIPSRAEVHSLKGLEAALPRLFGDVITFTGRQNATFYTKVASASVWTNGSTGTKEFILGSLAAVVNAVRATIDQRLPHGKELHTLARLALESSQTFIMSMVSFTEENRESYALSSYPEAMQWSLNSRLGYRVWQEVYLPCAGLMEKVEPQDLQGTAATVIYHVLRTLDIQESFLTLGIKNHSVVSSEYVKFLSTNTGYDSIEKLTVRMNKLETESKAVVAQAKEAGASAKTASTSCSELKKKVESHEKKISTLETRIARGN